MRKWHRWISTAAMVLLAWVAVTGVLLAIDSIYPPAGLGGTPETPATTPAAGAVQTLDVASLEQWMTTAISKSVPAGSTPASVDIQLRMQDDQPVATVSMGNAAGAVTVNVTTGTVTPVPLATPDAKPWYQDMQTRVRLHDVLQDLHRGTFIGVSGQVLDLLTGLSFAFLAISGAVMYFQLYLRRRKAGNKQWFWK